MGYIALMASFLLAVPSFGYQIVPGLTALAEPQCTYVTVYYNNPADLASATSSFLSSSTLCAAATTAPVPAATTAPVPAATTAPVPAAATSAAPNNLGCGLDPNDPGNLVVNPGFECTTATDVNFMGWTTSRNGASPGVVEELVPGTTNNPSFGNQMLAITNFPADGSTTWTLSQTINAPSGMYATTFNVKVFGNFQSCQLDIFGGGATGFYYSDDMGTSFYAYTQYWYNSDAGSVSTGLILSGCVHNPTFYIDNISVTTFNLDRS